MRVIVLLFCICFSAAAFADVKVGAPAPDFSEKDQSGKTRSLKDFKGQWLVLEWYNSGCPYVKKHYKSNNMQELQKKYTAKGVQWLAVATSAKGKQGYVDPAKAQEAMKSAGMSATAMLLDADGTMGRAYSAKTTPHMFIINPQGNVVYAGAIDDNDSANPAVIEKSENYVVSALDAVLAGKPVKVASTKPYGCSVEY